MQTSSLKHSLSTVSTSTSSSSSPLSNSNYKKPRRKADKLSKKELVTSLVDEIVLAANSTSGRGLDWLSKGLSTPADFMEVLTPTLLFLSAIRNGKEFKVMELDTATRESHPIYSQLHRDLFSIVWSEIHRRSTEIKEYNLIKNIKAMNKSDQQLFKDSGLLFTRALMKVRVFVINGEAGVDLKGLKAFSNYDPDKKATLARDFGLKSSGRRIIDHKKGIVIVRGHVLPRLPASAFPFASVDYVVERAVLEKDLNNDWKDLLELSRDPSACLPSSFQPQSLPLTSIKVIRVDILHDPYWQPAGDIMVTAADMSLNYRRIWGIRGDGKEIQGQAVGGGIRANQRGDSGFYRNLKPSTSTPDEIRDAQLRTLYRYEHQALDFLTSALKAFFPKLYEEEVQQTVINGEIPLGASQTSHLGGFMKAFDAGQHSEKPHTESKMCVSVGLGPSTSGLDPALRPEGAVSFIFGKLGGGEGAVIEGGEGTVFLWPAQDITHGTGFQIKRNLEFNGRKVVEEYGIVRTRKTLSGSNARRLKESKMLELASLLDYESKDGLEDSIEFDTDTGPVWYRGMVVI